ncbi:unnamed protein product [Calicophoron daubneyi]|uniref:Uncharacterized protein n=1 Tax=Calicophoron daubneyi TaxID=300641 RepID=A0AAV2TVM5_CALDB
MTDKPADAPTAVTVCQTTCDTVDERLIRLIKNERFLCDLLQTYPYSNNGELHLPSVEQVQNVLDLHFGKAMQLTLLRGDDVKLPLVVPITARVVDLRRIVQRKVTSYLKEIHEYRSSGSPHPDTSTKEQLLLSNPQGYTEPSHETQLSLLFTSPEFISWRSVWKTKVLALIAPQGCEAGRMKFSILCKLDEINKRLLEDYNVRSGAVITFVNRLRRK